MFSVRERILGFLPLAFRSHACVLFTITLITLTGCTSKGRVTEPANSPTLNDYVPVKVGNSFTYSTFSVHAAGTSDTSSPIPAVLSIIQANVLIGGQPNAFIVRNDNQRGNVSYLAFSISGNTLWHYLGGMGTFKVTDNVIVWIAGGIGGAVVEMNQTLKYYVTDQSGSSMSFTIVRSPDPLIAIAAMTAQDTVEVKGISSGETEFTLQKAGGTTADTMTVFIGVRDEIPSSVALPFPPWIPLWEMLNSSADKTIFSMDTTHAFKCIADGAECRDELHYLITNRYVGEEALPVLSKPTQCERFEMKVMVTETITYTDTIGTQILFSGYSTYYTIDMWLAKGIGFVRGSVNGSSRSVAASMWGSQDSSGVLQGFYISPRVAYASLPTSRSSFRQYFRVDDVPLEPSPVYNEFILVGKNF